ncbi:signal peptide peptidase SppA [Methyloceanibacter sp.]|uniref:signal peptide peptidase SppA n=1 Tax=Methyloceanibacter sp. TaxID=1965321 RepID=UPI002D49B575|nr:signal peptide peptidase SppA [Methyloceanibacter sp.]HZP08862.1 signal peptide peptidase SppA [Methyloceanibacter sp.]
MTLDAVSVVDRRRLKRRLTAWRIAAVLFAVLFFGALLLSDKNVSGSAGFLPHIARISISGIITDDRKMNELFDKVAKADQVKAVILDINSPGGTTTGGEAMYDAIRRLAEKKPVVAVCGTLATSAAYLVALATDRVFVYGNTITGSVGVIFQWADVTELLHTLGIKVEEVKSGPLKAVPSPFEPADEKTRALSEEMVQEAKTWFVNLVAERRKIDPAAVPGLTDGRIYSGRQAVDLKLVDQIGDERDAKTWLSKERNVPSGLKVVDWKPESESSGLFGWLFQSAAGLAGISAGRIAGLLGQVASTLKLDGLVSVWHPAGS